MTITNEQTTANELLKEKIMTRTEEVTDAKQLLKMGLTQEEIDQGVTMDVEYEELTEEQIAQMDPEKVHEMRLEQVEYFSSKTSDELTDDDWRTIKYMPLPYRQQVLDSRKEETEMTEVTTNGKLSQVKTFAKKHPVITTVAVATPVLAAGGFVAYKTGALTKAMPMFYKGLQFAKGNLPLALTIGGIALVGATAYYAYKAAPEVEKAVSELEARREAGEDVSKVEALVKVTKPFAKPILFGLTGVSMLAGSWYIQNGRINTLASTVQDYAKAYDDLKKGPEALTVENTFTDEEGNEVTTVDPNEALEKKAGRWFRDSVYFTSDDHEYNVEFIKAQINKMEDRLWTRGYISFNEVLDALGFERTRQGAMLGWSTSAPFMGDYEVSTSTDAAGDFHPDIHLTWNLPTFIYDNISYSGRYSQDSI